MDAQRLRQKIRKLLALAASGSGHEAASAGRHAERLLAEHNLRPEDLGDDPPHVILVSGRSWPIWRRALLTFAAQSNEVKALFRRHRKHPEAKLEGEIACCQRALTFYLDLVRVVNELETLLGERMSYLAYFFHGPGERKATDSVRRGIVYGLIRLHVAESAVILGGDPDLADVKKSTVSPPPSAGSPSAEPPSAGPVPSATPGDECLAKIEEARWEPMEDPAMLFDAASQELFDLGEKIAQACVVVDAAGYARVVNSESVR